MNPHHEVRYSDPNSYRERRSDLLAGVPQQAPLMGLPSATLAVPVAGAGGVAALRGSVAYGSSGPPLAGTVGFAGGGSYDVGVASVPYFPPGDLSGVVGGFANDTGVVAGGSGVQRGVFGGSGGGAGERGGGYGGDRSFDAARGRGRSWDRGQDFGTYGGGRGRGFDGGRGWGGRGPGRSRDDLDNIVLAKQDFHNLTPFEKNFYVEHPALEAMSEQDVTLYRKGRDITVEGRDVPKPIRFFTEANFPGIVLRCFHECLGHCCLCCVW